jgi:hypothetical protein
MEGSGYFMSLGRDRQGGGEKPSVVQVMKYKLENMEDVEGC